ncbi:hypothetical protein AB0M43_23705 [Longispora sp. NPDC051575]|uniref:hypothetical protein n=1 Tax=Longispora sp. NPDC051575 TaxID=3154943 RepID=UPI00341DAC37
MTHHLAAWIGAHAVQLRAYAPPSPEPTGFDWNKVHPDPSKVPNNELFYGIINGVLFLTIVASIVTLLGGAIAFGSGPIFGAHMLSDRGKSMMWKAMLIALVAGGGAALIQFLLKQ